MPLPQTDPRSRFPKMAASERGERLIPGRIQNHEVNHHEALALLDGVYGFTPIRAPVPALWAQASNPATPPAAPAAPPTAPATPPAAPAASNNPSVMLLKQGHTESVRAKAAQDLGKEGDLSTIPALAAALSDPSAKVRREVVLALAQFHQSACFAAPGAGHEGPGRRRAGYCRAVPGGVLHRRPTELRLYRVYEEELAARRRPFPAGRYQN